MAEPATNLFRPETFASIAENHRATRPAGTMSWPLWTMVAAATCCAAGTYWDVSWHISIGRDTFWTPAHVVIYAAGILSGLSSAYLILSATFGRDRARRQCGVDVLGFNGMLGSFIGAWGAGAMLTAAPFDNWWHSAYGLDVKVQSPPHALLGLGINAIVFGALFLVTSERNNAPAESRCAFDWLLCYLGAVLLTLCGVGSIEQSGVAAMHSGFYYQAVAYMTVILMAIAVASDLRWPATIVTGLYSVFWLAALWIFPMFPATPRLGPVYQHVTHMVPLGFPLMLIAPGIAIDLLRAKLTGFNSVRGAICCGCAFVLALLITQWPIADFLMSPASRNWVFGRNYFAYNDTANLLYDPYVFQIVEKTRGEFAINLVFAFMVASIAGLIGLAWGKAMRAIRR